MQTLAHFGDGGPGPWILFLPVIWALVVVGGIALLRRTVGRGRRGSGPGRPAAEDGCGVGRRRSFMITQRAAGV